jgi:uncharacterized protein YndB with AHSA1/START domain
MTHRDFSKTIRIAQTPEAAYAALLDVRGWWSEDIRGRTDTVGEVFDYRFRDVHRCKIRIDALTPGKRVAWHVLENHFSFTEDKSEWTGTDVVFDISRTGNETEIRLTHKGLVPDFECYEVCSDGWSTYLASLRDLISKGRGRPNAGQPMTESERALVP